MTADQFMDLVLDGGRNSGPDLMCDCLIAKTIDTPVLAEVIATVWSLAEYPESAGSELWLLLFGRAGFTIDGTPAQRPAEPMVLYRGAVPEMSRRMSWTTSRQKAQWFAGRFGDLFGEAFMYTTTAPPESILCIPGTEGRPDEAEVIIDPAGLAITQVTTTESSKPATNGDDEAAAS